MASVGPRPIATRLLVPTSVSTSSLQSSSAAAVSRSGSRSMAPPRSASSVQDAVRRNSAASVATNVLLAATLSSGPAPIGSTMSHAGTSGPSVALTIATVSAPAALALEARATRSSLLPDCEIARNSWFSRRSRLPVDAGDVGRGLGDGNTDIALDQVLAEGRRMGRAAAGTGDDDLRRPAFQPPDKLRQRLRQALQLPADRRRGFANLARHRHVGVAPALLRHGHNDLAHQFVSAADRASARASHRAPASASAAAGTRWRFVSGPSHGADARRQAAGQRHPPHADRAEPPGQHIDMSRGKLHELATRRVVLARMLDDEGCERCKLARLRRAHPAHDGMRVGVELLEHAAQQAGPGRAPVMRPQHAAHHLATEPRAAALVGNRETPTTHAMVPPGQRSPRPPCRCRR